MTRRFRALLEAYGNEGKFNVTEAARLAGYRCPEKVGHRLRKRFPEAFAEVEQRFREGLKVQREEVEERIADLARNPKHRDHFKALELLAKMHGMLSEKVNVTIDRSNVNSNLDELVRSMTVSRAIQRGIAIVAAGDALTTIPNGKQPAAIPTSQQPALAEDVASSKPTK